MARWGLALRLCMLQPSAATRSEGFGWGPGWPRLKARFRSRWRRFGEFFVEVILLQVLEDVQSVNVV